MFADNLFDSLKSHGDKTAFIYQDKSYSYSWLVHRANEHYKIF